MTPIAFVVTYVHILSWAELDNNRRARNVFWRGAMIFAIRKHVREPVAVGPARVPDGMRIFVVGDVHGRVDLLDAVAAKIEDDLQWGRFTQAATVFLGDYIDRGPHSARVIERLSRGDFPTPVIALRGNHEDVLLKFLDNERALEHWRHYGGLETLFSYGVDARATTCGRGYDVAQAALRQNLPLQHLTFLQETRPCWSLGGYFFCHAGVRPGVALADQNEQDLLWIREEFAGYRGSFEKIIVHGHTVVDKPEILPNRIGIDTGAYATGVLTCLVLEDRDRRFIST